MSGSEFDIIRRYFTDQQVNRQDVKLGIGDDAALLQPPLGQTLVASIDTLVGGVHFPVDTSPESIGYKALAVNLSDMAAMGAEPAWFMLSIALPDADEKWLLQFSTGLFSLANEYKLQLVGGDTTRNPHNKPVSITLQIMGFVPEGEALTRSGASVGDAIYVTGTLGDAAAGLQIKQGQLNSTVQTEKQMINKLERPQPRIDFGLALRGLASAAIDISDGLSADLGHVLVASQVGADIAIDRLPISDAFKHLKITDGWQFAASAGDDYELCFTINNINEKTMLQTLNAAGCKCTKIGVITEQPGLRWFDSSGDEQEMSLSGYDHFFSSDESRE